MEQHHVLEEGQAEELQPFLVVEQVVELYLGLEAVMRFCPEEEEEEEALRLFLVVLPVEERGW